VIITNRKIVNTVLHVVRRLEGNLRFNMLVEDYNTLLKMMTS